MWPVLLKRAGIEALRCDHGGSHWRARGVRTPHSPPGHQMRAIRKIALVCIACVLSVNLNSADSISLPLPLSAFALAVAEI